MTVAPPLVFHRGTADDAEAVAAMRNRAAAHLGEAHGPGPWAEPCHAGAVIAGLRGTVHLLIGRIDGEVAASLRLAAKKPWAIDSAYFTPVKRPIHLVDMAVDPAWQRRGVGRAMLDEAARVVAAWPGDAIRLDAYDADAGASGFYHRSGYAERGRVTFRGTPLVYFERLL